MPVSAELIGKKLGDFEIVREIGRGGMGVVYEALQSSLNRRVALKVLGNSFSLTPQAVGRFRREAEAAAKLHHTNIVPVYAVGMDRDTHFYAMELIDGPSLDAVIRQVREQRVADIAPELTTDLVATHPYVSPATPYSDSTWASGSSAARFDRAAAMIADVAVALHHAHQQGVIHRDIKPSNLMLSPDGRLSVTDFGLARVLDQPGVTVTGEFVGTPAYMSPEQITAGRIPVDHRTDIYSLGATLYELLTLRAPFIAKGRDQILALVIQKEPRPPRSIESRIPRDLDTICIKCLEKDPDRRYQSARDLADDLRRYVNRFAILARRSGVATRAMKWVKRNPWVACLVVAMLLAGSTAGFFAWRAETERQQRLADELQRTEESLAQKREAAIERGMVAVLATDLTGAEKAIAEAEALGASPGEIRMLRGFMALHNGQPAKAVADLEQAARLMPDRIAPRALLSGAYEFEADPEMVRMIAEMEAMSPSTPEDKLFKGMAIAISRPAEGLRLIDEGLAERSSTLGHLLRADARLKFAQSTGSVPDAERAVVASELANQLLPDNPARLGKYCSALLTAMSAHERSGNRAKADEYLAAARQAAANLAHFDQNPTALMYRFDVASAVDGLDGKFDLTAELRAANAGRRERMLAWCEACNWFCLGNDREVDAVASDNPSFYNSCLRALAALSRPDGRPVALAAIKGSLGADASWRERFRALPLLYALDRATFATVLSRLQRERDPLGILGSAELRRNSLAFLDGKVTEQQFLAIPSQSQLDLCLQYYFLAWKRLGDGDREGARRAFEEAYQLKLFDAHFWVQSRPILIRMKDPNWPQALLKKK